MNIDYHEATVLAHVRPRGKRLTLEDFHRHVWALFANNAADRALEQRPFIFRFDAFDARRWLLTIRCDRPFTGAEHRRIAIQPGDEMVLDLASIPSQRYGHNGNRAVTPPSEQWPHYYERLFERAGLSLVNPADCVLMGRLPQFGFQRRTLPLASARASARIDDVSAFARAYLDGVGRRRGYGFGLLRLAPTSDVQDQAA